ncbi:hypothetical protein [Pimelobacter simplex]|uniref:hypothetical protein n=1 Tax=Nocardioides simplex TaxID=2045 RepID=UPI0021501AEE|nr:hypothetical protein [Pimelobacter simplex]UUW88407.1 hypothetical protein M0M43_22045 [Pimelobacter simplex]UUW97911.1 hypothetical protein M0M48_10690 [Pimelobacter simplex]
MSRRTTTRPEVRITANGAAFWLSTIVPFTWGELKHSTRTNGSWQASWTIPIVPNWRHPALVYGAAVEIFLGPVCVWAGSLEEPNWDAGEFVAIGACRDAETNPGLTSLGVASTVPNVVVDAAIADGGLAGWTRVGDLGATAVGQADGTGGLVSISSILDAAAQEAGVGTRWVVNEQRQVLMSPVDETKPTWHVIPGSGVLGSAAEERVDRIYVRYIDATTGRRATVSYPTSGPARMKRTADITDRGLKTVAQATAIAQDEWNKLQGRSGWTNGLTLTAGQVTTPGGAIADLALVRAGDTVRLLGVPDARGLAQNTDVVLAETDYDWADDQLQANPVGRAARDENSVLEQVGNLAVDASTRASAGSGMTPFAVAIGEAIVTLSAAAVGNTAILFPAGRFTVPPKVQATIQDAPGGSQTFVPRVINATVNGASVYIYTGNSATATATVKVAWEAVQMTSTSAVG